MKIDDDRLMAYADGELDEAERRGIEVALAQDPVLAERVRVHAALRTRVASAFAAALDEAVPGPLLQAVAAWPETAAATTAKTPLTTPTASVVDLGQARAARTAPRRPAFGTWAQWGGMAASVAFGLVLGLQMRSSGNDASLAEGPLAAPGALAAALTTQVAGTETSTGTSKGTGGANPAVAIRLSFIDREGRYCRSFVTSVQAGLACKGNERWNVVTLVQATAPASGDMRQATSALPAALLSEIDARIAGDPLNAAAEEQARAQGWKR